MRQKSPHDRLREWAIENYGSLEKASQKLKIPRSTIYKFSAGTRKPGREYALFFEEKIGIKAEEW